jgi:hypothetical protein
MIPSRRSARRLAVLLAALFPLFPGLAREEPPVPTEASREAMPVHLHVQAARGVAELDRRSLERAIVIRLTGEERCPVRLVEKPDQALVHVDLRLQKWLDRRTTDGVWRTDPRTGREIPGMRYEIWGVYDLEIRLRGREKPLERWKDESFRSAAREGRNPLFDARAQALEEAHERILDRIAREVCDEARDRARERSGGR